MFGFKRDILWFQKVGFIDRWVTKRTFGCCNSKTIYIVATAAKNIGISQVNFLSKLAEIVIMIFTIAMALEQLKIGATIVQLTITIILGSFGLGFALAFGLGCKDIVGKSVEKFIENLKK